MGALVLFQLVLMAVPLPEPTDIQRAGIEARKKVRSGDMEFEIYDGLPSKAAPHDIDWKLNVRDRLIFDTRPAWSAYLERWQPGEPVLLKNGEPLIQRAPNGGHRLRVVVSPTVCLQFTPDQLTGGGGFGITSDSPGSDAIEYKLVMHPWRFGLITANFGGQYDLDFEDDIAPPDQRDITIEEDLELGSRCWKLTFRRDNGHIVTTWFDPSRGMNVCKIVKTGVTKFGRFVASVTSKLKHYPRAGIWYPEEVVYRGVMNNDELDASLEKLVVTRADFNIEIDPVQFTAKALEAPPQTLIISRKREPGPTKLWDGEKIAPLTAMHPLANAEPPPRQREWLTTRQMFLVAGMILLLLAAVIGLARQSRV